MDDAQLRSRLAELLENGLDNSPEVRAYTSEDVNRVVAELQKLVPGDYVGKLTVAGFTSTPYDDDELEQSCATCMYYVVHRQFCELPELMLPVRSNWLCRLWRI
ncbi:MAG: hypothetical protein HY028_03320 [Gammaproteobacteria bacterium]|nr:hypothetical protein [Gammaproteobacteria bacterium]